MATNISARLVLLKLRPHHVIKLPVQPYCCCVFKWNCNSKLHVQHGSALRIRDNLYEHHYSIPKALPIVFQPFSSMSQDNKVNPEQKPEKLSLFKRFKQMYRDYWYVLVPVHLVTSAAWLAGFYYLASSGVDIPALLEFMNFNEKIVNSMRNSSMGYVAITYGLYKIATPIRYAITLGGTTVSINYLTKWGYIKPMPSKERLKEIYAETKEGMKEKRENLIESVQSLQKTVKDTREGIKERKDSIVSSVKESKRSLQNIKEKVIGSKSHKEGKP
ncbi:uncharacterized protein C18orf19 homolog A [Anthonomus grandis grandis]|uniref:uncharacterized protein C18orf19 homolog A n=1 Tax=Anthonomus grandis grandis TaxID=2921223 RepID=UPI002166A049|nr:uncharacterized protein C18orf19 homolog A [Anthonomus grandis grandis]